MADYVTLAQLKESMQLTPETFADNDLRRAITAASETVASITGRRFDLDEEDVERIYVPERETWIEIDDLVAVTSIESDLYDSGEATAWATSDYRLEPINGPADGHPYTALRLSVNGAFGCFYPREGTISITGRWGWPEVPKPVEEATLMLASRYVKRVREAPFGIAGIGADGQSVRVSASDPDVAMLLRPYARTIRLA